MFQKTMLPILLVFLLGLGLLLSSCSSDEPQSLPEELIKIKVNMLPYMSFAPFAFAEAEGYFAEQGLEVEFVQLGSDVEAIVALIQGDLDVTAHFVGVGMLNAIAEEGNIQIVADKGFVAPTGCTVNAILARQDLVDSGELQTPLDLNGRMIAMEIPTLEGYIMDELLSEEGLTLDDIETTDLPPPAEIDAIETGAIDLTVTSEPWVTRLLQAGSSTVWMSLEELVPDLQFAVVLFGPNLLEENPDAGNRFMVAYLKAVRQYNEGKTEQNMERMMEYTQDDQAFLEQVCWPTFRADGVINTQSILDFQEWAIAKGFLETEVTEDQFWNASFVDYANEILDTP